MSDLREPIEPRPPDESPRHDFDALRAKLGAATGRQYWRSLDELAESDAFTSFLHAEFPREASVLDAVGRRQFLQLMGASMALAGVSACTKQPVEKIVPYVKMPEEVIPGEPLFFATAINVAGEAAGVLVESHMGRPTKVEGNPDHPVSLGATDVFSQAVILELYDPDRSQVVLNAGSIRPYAAFLATAQALVEKEKGTQGAGFRILTETVTSPSLAAQIREVLQELPQAKWHQYQPINRDNPQAGALLAFGEVVDQVLRLENADVIVSLDADFLSSQPGNMRYTREFARRRKVTTSNPAMNRLYVVESTPTATGSNADHRLPLRSTDIEAFTRALATALGVANETAPSMQPHAKWVKEVAADLQTARGRSVIVAGPAQPPGVHALAYLMNQALGNIGQTLQFVEPVAIQPVNHLASLKELTADMEAGKVNALVILGGNPVYDTPADLRFAELLDKVETRLHAGLYNDETARLCHWHVPLAHQLETWGDTRAHDGTLTIQQPLIAPLYNGRSASEVLAAFTGRPTRPAHDIVRDYWKATWGDSDFDTRWRKSLHDGLVAGSAAPIKPVTAGAAVVQTLKPLGAPAAGMELVIRQDPHVHDGRFNNNGWLQELPRPVTKLTWDNAALLSPVTAERLRLRNEDVVELKYQGRVVKAPVWVTPGHANDSVTVHLGYGRTQTGKVGAGTGFNAYTLLTSAAPGGGAGLEVRKTGERYSLACTQDHFSMEGRDIVRSATLEEFKRNPHIGPAGQHTSGGEHGNSHHEEEEISFYSDWKYPGYAWGMSIDLSACTGCNACTIACQAENNIAVVGKDQVSRGREMHWIRVDRYFEGDLDNPQMVHQPVPCMQCENAPCELVCPVNATVHGEEGLNDMVYNRCVGTKYCSNNCPYKVRRFNFYLYQDFETETYKSMRNPDVTVRSRGVMEKCTYCVQRINQTRIAAKREDRRIVDGEVQTACQQVCPAEAIVFGDINEHGSKVAQERGQPRSYALLAELNTRPRTTYLAAVTNPNPKLAGGKGEA